MSDTPALQLRRLGVMSYEHVWRAMQSFTQERTSEQADQLWLVQHPPVYTQGQAGKPEHILCPGDIPVVATDRGGQVTYHGPGQLVAYPLLDIRRLGVGVRDLVTHLENSVIDYLSTWGVVSQARADAPGVYVAGSKIASLGLRVKRGCSFHGVSLNVNMDLAPFLQINPCGYNGLKMTQLVDHVPASQVDFDTVESAYAQCLANHLNLNEMVEYSGLP